jgi:hypothetical protein
MTLSWLIALSHLGAVLAGTPLAAATQLIGWRFSFVAMGLVTDDMLDDVGVSGTLTFAGQPFHVALPWTAVYAAMVEGEQRGTVWPEDVPEDVLTGGGDPPAPMPVPAMEEPPPPRAKRQSHLKLVD